MEPTELSAIPIAKEYDEEIKDYIDSVRETHRKLPTLLVFQYKHDKDAELYLRSINRIASKVGIEVIEVIYDRGMSLPQYLEIFNKDMSGILLLNPLPEEYTDLIRKVYLDELIDYGPDVDCFTSIRRGINFSFPGERTAPLAQAITNVLDYYKPDLSKYNKVVVVGRSILSKQIANQLLAKDYSVSLVHTNTYDINMYLEHCDFLITGANIADSLQDKNYIASIPYLIDISSDGSVGKALMSSYNFMFDNYISNIGRLTTSILLKNTVENYKTLGLGEPFIKESDNE